MVRRSTSHRNSRTHVTRVVIDQGNGCRPKRVVLYVRVSYRRHGVSIPDQIENLRRQAMVAGEEIVAIFVDYARSGTKAANRVEYQKMKALVEQGECDLVRAESLDRGHRNELERLLFEQEMEMLGVEVVYLGESFGVPPELRRFERGIRGNAAQLESDGASQRTYTRQRYRVSQQQKWSGGPIPFGVLPDGDGWFLPDPASYDVLIWILEQRAQALGHHSITKMLNNGISISGGAATRPPTPGLLAYRRHPYREKWSHNANDIVEVPRTMPQGIWTTTTVKRICQQAVDGIYNGHMKWGTTYNRFNADLTGQPKQPIHVDVGKPLVPPDLLHRVREVEQAAATGEPMRMSEYDTFLLALRCDACTAPVNGYSSSKKSRGRLYHYRQYRCTGRSNKPGTCRMPKPSADLLEHAVLHHLAAYVREQVPHFKNHIRTSLKRYEADLEHARNLLVREMTDVDRRRDEAVHMLAKDDLSSILHEEYAMRLEDARQKHSEYQQQLVILEAGQAALKAQRQNVEAIYTEPLDLKYWRETEVHIALKHALHKLIEQANLALPEPHHYQVNITLRSGL